MKQDEVLEMITMFEKHGWQSEWDGLRSCRLTKKGTTLFVTENEIIVAIKSNKAQISMSFIWLTAIVNVLESGVVFLQGDNVASIMF